jgi:hypothetical protein
MVGDAGDEPGRVSPAHPPLQLLVDSNAFGRRAWIQTLVDAAQSEYVRLYWSPTIIEEMARMRQFIWIRNWLKSGGTELTEAVRRRFSAEAHRWMDFIGPHFHVVEDKPPFALAWADPMPDPYDAPIWTAARRANAHIVVTQNLRDGPPRNERGLQVFDGVLYLDPKDLAVALGWWGDFCVLGSLESAEHESGQSPEGDTTDASLPPAIQSFLRDIAGQLRGGERSSADDEAARDRP